jgi:VWFA-related protein
MRSLALASLLLLCATAHAQFSEVLEVRVTNIDVMVTKDGKPVTGLTRDDFEVYENGVRKDISNFLEVREDSATMSAEVSGAAPETVMPPAARPRSIVVFVDDAALEPMRRNAVLPHLKKFFATQVRPGDQVSIVAWSSGLKVILEPTTDPLKIADGVDSLAKRVPTGFHRTQERERFYRAVTDLIVMYRQRDEVPPYTLAINLAREYADKLLYDVRTRIAALQSVLAAARGEQGRKVLVLLTQSLSSNPADEAFLYLDSIREQFAGATSLAIMDAREFVLPSLITDIAHAANSAGVTLYPIDAAGKGSDFRGPDASSNEMIPAKGLVVAESAMPTLHAIAAETGGVALAGSTNFELAFERIANDLSTYYSLGYRSTGERADRLNRVEVKVKKRGLAVRTRTAVVEQSLASEMQDAVTANLFRRAATNELQVAAEAGAPVTRADGMVTIPVTVTFPTARLTLIPEGADVVGGFAVHAAFLRSDGAVSKVERRMFPVRLPAESLPRRKTITVKIDVEADARTKFISVGVLDETSRATGFASVDLLR